MLTEIKSALNARIDTFPTLPAVVGRVMEITADPDSDTQDLMEVISVDQSLTATILKMANSAFYGFPREVASLKHALTVLGFAEIQNLVLSKAVFNSFKNIDGDDHFDMNKFWEHSFCCGLAAKILARHLKKGGNEFFVAGLIHDIGKLVMLMALPQKFNMVLKEAGTLGLRTRQAEKRILGITHDDVGMMLLKRWLFPEPMLDAVEYHHRPMEKGRHASFPMIVHLADLLTHLENAEAGEASLVEQGLDEASCYPDIIAVLQGHEIDWQVSDLDECRKALTARIEAESGALSLLLS